MKFIRFYVVASLVLGVLQIADGIVLVSYGTIAISNIFSLLEAIWVVVSMIALWFFIKSKFPIFIPTTYILYNVAGWGYGAYLFSQLQNSDQIIDVPLWFKIAGICFGIYFACVNFILYKRKL